MQAAIYDRSACCCWYLSLSSTCQWCLVKCQNCRKVGRFGVTMIHSDCPPFCGMVLWWYTTMYVHTILLPYHTIVPYHTIPTSIPFLWTKIGRQTGKCVTQACKDILCICVGCRNRLGGRPSDLVPYKSSLWCFGSLRAKYQFVRGVYESDSIFFTHLQS